MCCVLGVLIGSFRARRIKMVGVSFCVFYMPNWSFNSVSKRQASVERTPIWPIDTSQLNRRQQVCLQASKQASQDHRSCRSLWRGIGPITRLASRSDAHSMLHRWNGEDGLLKKKGKNEKEKKRKEKKRAKNVKRLTN